MILKMAALAVLFALLTVLISRITKDKKPTVTGRILIGVVYGIGSVLSTHFGVDYGHMLLNVRDMGPLSAGLFFHPLSGVIAGLIGGIERYIAGRYWGIGAYTRIACSVSTCFAGFLTIFLYYFIFKEKRPSPGFAFFVGAVMEVFHMYAVYITHLDDMNMAYYVVKNCSAPMILFTGAGMALSSAALIFLSGDRRSPFRRLPKEQTPLAERFRHRLFIVIMIIFAVNYAFSYAVQTQTALQNARAELAEVSEEIIQTYKYIQGLKLRLREYTDPEGLDEALGAIKIGQNGSFEIIDSKGNIHIGKHRGRSLSDADMALVCDQEAGFFVSDLFDLRSLCLKTDLIGDETLLVQMPFEEIYEDRDQSSLEMAFSDILLLAGLYILISFLVRKVVVDDLDDVVASLNKISDGDLNEVISVRNSMEFSRLSDDVNHTVTVLKGYIDAAEKRMEQELEYARIIQESALPRNFKFPRNDFELFALMDPAKEVGGDFYDFFFVDTNKLALVIADVAGKGIPAALFMMRSKTTIRTLTESGLPPSEVLFRANNALCEGNDADMFVTVWIGIIDLETGHMVCANAGHEYPVIMRKGGEYDIFKDKHSLALAAMPGIRTKEYEIDLNPGDRLFVYTDGIPEAINERTEEYGIGRLLRKLNLNRDVSMENTLPSVRADIDAFAGKADQFDDITMLGVIYNGPDAE